MTSGHLLILTVLILGSLAQGESALVANTKSTARAADGRFISWHEHIIDDPRIGALPDLAGSDGLAMGDLNADGFEDIVSVHESDIVYDGSPVGYVRVAWGTGDPTRWQLSTMASGPEAAAAEDVSIADANGDGHLDVVVACELAHLIYFENPGADAQNSRQSSRWARVIPSITSERGSYIRAFFADFDNDGRPEVVAANKGDQSAGEDVTERRNVSVFILPENPLEGSLWREQVLGKVRVPINSEPVDLDGDGDLDVVGGSRGEARILWFENLGDLQFAEHAIEVSDIPADLRITGFNMDYADLDGDDRLDIVVNAWPASLVWLKQPARFGEPWELYLIGTFTPDQLVSVRLADIDGDGDLDAFAGAYSRGPRDADGANIGRDDPIGRIGWFENPGAKPQEPWQRHDVSRRKRGMYDKWLARDLDGDGDLDMIGTRGNSHPYDGVIWLEQVRTDEPQAAFQQSRGEDSQQMPLPSGESD